MFMKQINDERWLFPTACDTRLLRCVTEPQRASALPSSGECGPHLCSELPDRRGQGRNWGTGPLLRALGPPPTTNPPGSRDPFGASASPSVSGHHEGSGAATQAEPTAQAKWMCCGGRRQTGSGGSGPRGLGASGPGPPCLSGAVW